MMSVNVGMMRTTPPMMMMTMMTKQIRALHQSRSFAVTAAAATAGGPSTSSSSTPNPAKPIPEWSNESNKDTSSSEGERAAVRASSSSSRSRRHRRSDWPLLLPADSFFFRDPFLLGDSLFSSPSATRHPLARHWLGPLQSLLGGIGVGIGGAGGSSPAVTAGAAGAAGATGAATNTNAIGALNNMFATAMAPLDDVSRGVWNWEAELLNPVRMELDEADHKYVMRVRVPGMSKNDLHVKVEPSGYLHLWGEHVERANEKGKAQEQQQQQAKQEESAEKAERGDGVSSVSFERWIALPDSVHVGDIHAKFENGALLISLPKTEEAKQAQRSEIAIE